jgi:lysophospholipase L1-like esterase
MRTRSDRRNDRTKLYADAVFAAGRLSSTPVADIYYSMMRPKDWATRYLSDDGLHLSAAGNRFVADQVQGAINKDLKAVA